MINVPIPKSAFAIKLQKDPAVNEEEVYYNP